MKRAAVRKKVSAYWRAHPEQHQRIYVRAVQASQRKNPSGLERKLWAILDDIGVSYDTQVIIKPKFVVDVMIENLIIQADGDYWHGHPDRFPILTSRQKRQRKRDRAQDAYLHACGYTVVRIWESDMSHDTVLSVLENHLGKN